MSNDYRNNNKDNGWYYSEGKRYVPQHMIEEERRRRAPGDPRRRPRRYDSSPHGYHSQRGRSAPPRRYPDHYQGYVPEFAGTEAQPSAGLDKSGRAARNVFICSLLLLLLIFAAIGGAYFYVNQNIIGRISFASAASSSVSPDDITLSYDMDYSGDLPEPLSVEELSAIEQNISAAAIAETALVRQDGVTNILVLCVDPQGDSAADYTCDITMLLSINENTGRVILNLLQRDCFVSIPGKSRPDRLGTAYAYGGAALAVSTVETNFGVDIDRYAVVDLYAFRNIIDALGGLSLSITDTERQVMNRRIEEVNVRLGLHADSGKLFKVGDSILLTGKQVLGYMRVSSTDSGSMTRAERQTSVIEKTISQFRSAGYAAKYNAMEALAAGLTTDCTETEVFSLLISSLEYSGYELTGGVLPVDGTWRYVNADNVIVIDFDITASRNELINTIYN